MQYVVEIAAHLGLLMRLLDILVDQGGHHKGRVVEARTEAVRRILDGEIRILGHILLGCVHHAESVEWKPASGLVESYSC